MRESRVGNVKLQAKAIDLLEKTGIPVSIDYVAYNLGVAWGTVRAMLMNLAIQGKVKFQKTTKSLIFWVDRKGRRTVERD